MEVLTYIKFIIIDNKVFIIIFKINKNSGILVVLYIYRLNTGTDL